MSDADLSGVDLSSDNLSSAILNDASLNDASLNDANLSGAHLGNAFLGSVNLDDASLNGADLSGVQLNDANLNNADLSDAFLNDADLNGAFLGYATLNGAHLNGADLSNAILNYADLSNADLSNANNLLQPQLKEVYSCTNVISTGLTCPYSRSVVTLTYWYTESPAEQPVILRLIQNFRHQNPNIRIKAVYKPFSVAQAEFITAAHAGNAPDVLRSDISWVPQLASQGYLRNIDSLVSKSDLSDYHSVSSSNGPLSYDPLSSDTYKEHLYGLPQVTDFLALLYNKAELAKVGITSHPTTMDDFEADAIKIRQSEAPTYGFETDGEAYYALPFLWAFSGGMIDQQNNILVNNPGSVNGLTFLLKLQNIDQVMPAKVDFSNGYSNMVNDFKSGQTAMIFDGPYEVSNILTGSAFTSDPSNLGIAPIPTGPTGQTGSPRGGQSYVISAHTEHLPEAYKFISFMSSKDSQVAIATANYTLPTRQSAYQDPEVSGNPVIKEFLSVEKTAITRPAIPQGRYLFDAFDLNIQSALNGPERPLDALNAVADAWRQLLAGSSG